MSKPAKPAYFVRGPSGLESAELDLPLDFTVAEEAPLRAAFAQLEFAHDHKFEDTMKVPALATAIRNAAIAFARARQEAARTSQAPKPAPADDWGWPTGNPEEPPCE